MTGGNLVGGSTNKASDIAMTAAWSRHAFGLDRLVVLDPGASHGCSPRQQSSAVGHSLKIQLAGLNPVPAIEEGDLPHGFGRHGVANCVILAEPFVRPFASGPDDIGDSAMEIDGDRSVHTRCGIGGDAMLGIVANSNVDVGLDNVQKNTVIRFIKIESAVCGVYRHSRARRKVRHPPPCDVRHNHLHRLPATPAILPVSRRMSTAKTYKADKTSKTGVGR
jgi:hypothetical protein